MIPVLPKFLEQISDDVYFLIDMISINDVDYIRPYVKNSTIVVDGGTWFYDLNFSLIYLHLEEQSKILSTAPLIEQFTTPHSVNFLINRKQTSRYLTIKMVELFNLHANYTWSGIGRSFDMSTVLQELQSTPSLLTDAEKNFLLSPINLEKRWIEATNTRQTNYGVKNYGANHWTWTNGLNDIVAGSAVSLITESGDNQRMSAYSEKTLYAMLGLTFPLWIGGYSQAAEWQRCGFDIFDDVIDHSYQHCKTLTERCIQAIKLNLPLLQDYNKLCSLRQQHKQRLLANRDLVVGDHFAKLNNAIFASWTPELQSATKKLFDAVRNQ